MNTMLQRLYVHNYRCLENFEFNLEGADAALLIGKNGSGKSTIRQVLQIFQAIGRSAPRVGQLVSEVDFAMGRRGVPMRFELQVSLASKVFNYVLALELPERFRELRILEERLSMDGHALFTREHAQTTVHRSLSGQPDARFNIDWHLVGLPIIQDPVAADALSSFRGWLARMVLLAPIPKLLGGEATGDSAQLDSHASNVADWLSSLLEIYPAAYAALSRHLQQAMPDLSDFRFERTGRASKTLLVRFKADTQQMELPFSTLSDGEKCFFLCAVVLAAAECDGPLFAFWDEPGNDLSLDEVSPFVTALRAGFKATGSQIMMTSHNEETIRRFSNENTWVLGRRSHLEPTLIRWVDSLPARADLVQSLIEGDVDPWQ